MDDTQQGNEPVEETLPPAIPTENKPAEATEPTLPDGVAERTAAEFEKLKQHNADLKTQLDAIKGKTSVLDEFKVPTIEPSNPAGDQTKRFVDAEGFIDVDRVDSALKQAEERAKRAEEKADRIEKRIQDSEESVQVKAAHAEFPQLDPHSDKFDPNFYRLVKLEVVDQMMHGERDLMKAAKAITGLYHPPVDVQKAQTEAVEEFKGKVIKRDQASEPVQGRGKGETTDREELVKRTQAGDKNALYKRLQASGN